MALFPSSSSDQAVAKTITLPTGSTGTLVVSQAYKQGGLVTFSLYYTVGTAAVIDIANLPCSASSRTDFIGINQATGVSIPFTIASGSKLIKRVTGTVAVSDNILIQGTYATSE